jgi:hypothetical protein
MPCIAGFSEKADIGQVQFLNQFTGGFQPAFMLPPNKGRVDYYEK